jgi:hypothetical protein
MASLTFAAAKSLLAEYVTSQGAADPIVASAINFVNERFITSAQWRGNRFIMNFNVTTDEGGNYVFDTVAGVESVLKVIALNADATSGEIADIFSDWFPWVEGGLGWLPANYAGATQIIRQGPVKSFPLPSGNGAGLFTVDTQRYRVIGNVPENRTLYCIVRRGYVPLVNDTDRLVPSNRNAYRYGIQAFNYENINELERAKVYWELAYQCLNEETASFEEGEQVSVDIQTKGFAPSLIQNLI